MDEPYTMKGYRLDFDLLVIVNHRKLCEFADFWHKVADRINRDPSIETPVSFIVHSRREVNTYLREGNIFSPISARKGSFSTSSTTSRSPNQKHIRQAYSSIFLIVAIGMNIRIAFVGKGWKPYSL